MSIERPNLANAFKGKATQPVDRSSGLAGLLPPPRRAPEPTTTTPGTAPTEDAHTPKPPTSVRKPRPSAKTQQADAPNINNVAVYLEPDLLALVKDARRIRGLSYDELTVEAFANVSDDALRAHFKQGDPSAGGKAMPARRRRPRGTSGIQIQLRLDSAQRLWLDAKREDVAAPSRSALVAAALRLQLG